jgi:hypothetical protein
MVTGLENVQTCLPGSAPAPSQLQPRAKLSSDVDPGQDFVCKVPEGPLRLGLFALVNRGMSSRWNKLIPRPSGKLSLGHAKDAIELKLSQ